MNILRRFDLNLHFVELAGVEPASKQVTNTLSTCLSGYCFSCVGWQSAADLHLIPLISLLDQDLPTTIPNSLHLLAVNRWAWFPRDGLFLNLVQK